MKTDEFGFRQDGFYLCNMIDCILYCLLGINILTFLVYGLDKWDACFPA